MLPCYLTFTSVVEVTTVVTYLTNPLSIEYHKRITNMLFFYIANVMVSIYIFVLLNKPLIYEFHQIMTKNSAVSL